MKADRLLAILLRLDTERRVTANELAAELEVSPRTILRDLEALSAAGVPVVAERGTGGGWFLLRPYRTDLSGLSAAEASALFLPVTLEHLSGLGLGQPAASGRAKLQAAFSEQVRVQVAFMQARILVETPGWELQEEALQHLALIQTALWQEQQIRFLYQRMTGETMQRDLDPFGLVFRSGRWYVVGMTRQALETFRIDRIRQLDIARQASRRPHDFDLKAGWEQTYQELLAQLPVCGVTLQLPEALLPELTFNVRFCKVDWQQPAPELGPGMWRAHLTLDTPEAAFSFVMGFGPRVWIEEPLELRGKVLAAARAMLEQPKRNPVS